jgi:hypothetical protein
VKRLARIPLGLQRTVALGAIGFCAILTVLLTGVDAYTYYAAGERLNAGHQLYSLMPDDRPVNIVPPFWTVPLLSPPLIAVIFRPLAVLPLPIAVGMFVGVQAIAILVVVWQLVRDWRRMIFVLVLSFSLGLALVIGNVNGLLLVGYVLVWRFRDRAWVGALVAVMGVVKLLPFVLVGFLIARRQPKQLAWFAGGCVVAGAVSLVGAGWQAHLDYVGVVSSHLPEAGLLSGLSGIRWLSTAILAAGMLFAAALPELWAFRVAIVTIVLGAPGPAALSQLVAVAVRLDAAPTLPPIVVEDGLAEKW